MERLRVGPDEPTRHEKFEEVVSAIVEDRPDATEKLLKLADEVSSEAMASIKKKVGTEE